MRKIHLNDQVWEYTIGKENVVIRNPNTGKKHIVDFSKLTGRTWNVLERGLWKKTTDGMIEPNHVKSYIENNLMKEVKQSD